MRADERVRKRRRALYRSECMRRRIVDHEPRGLILVGVRDGSNVRPETRITLSGWPDTFVQLKVYHCIRI